MSVDALNKKSVKCLKFQACPRAIPNQTLYTTLIRNSGQSFSNSAAETAHVYKLSKQKAAIVTNRGIGNHISNDKIVRVMSDKVMYKDLSMFTLHRK